MTVKELMDTLASYDPEMEVHVPVGDECYDEVGSVRTLQYSEREGWFYDPDFEEFDANDCTPVVAILFKNA